MCEKAPQPTVYSGGDHEIMTSMLGAAGPDVIYCGDHLHADVVKCRKLCEWRTLLIVPELLHEVRKEFFKGKCFNVSHPFIVNTII